MARWMGLAVACWCVAVPADAQEGAADRPPLVAVTLEDPGSGTQAYVFGDRIRAFADEHAVPLAYVLACAVAHELGHLLLPANAHEDGGIMRGSWNPRLLPPKTPGIQGFSARQTRLLRLRSRRVPASPE